MALRNALAAKSKEEALRSELSSLTLKAIKVRAEELAERHVGLREGAQPDGSESHPVRGDSRIS